MALAPNLAVKAKRVRGQLQLSLRVRLSCQGGGHGGGLMHPPLTFVLRSVQFDHDTVDLFLLNNANFLPRKEKMDYLQEIPKYWSPKITKKMPSSLFGP